MFEGTIPAIITPFKDSPREKPAIDFDTLTDLIEWQLQCGISALCICGTTAEAPTLDDEEKLAIIKHSIGVANGRVPVVAGTGSNNTYKSVAFTKAVKELGADGALVVSPYYNKPNQEGLYQHFKAVATEGGLPVILYNIPGRTNVTIEVETFRRLAEMEQIVAVKQAVDSADALLQLADAVGDKISILAGDCGLTYSVLSVGGKGVISASANVIPKEMVAITDAGLAGDMASSRSAQTRVLPVIGSLFVETNPAPVKAALKIMGKIPSETHRLPLVPVTDATRELLKSELSKLSIL